MIKKQLADWQLDYFDLFLIHFPISIAYVDPAHRYPCEWFGDDGKIHLGMFSGLCRSTSAEALTDNTPYQKTYETLEEFVDQGLAKNIGVR